MAEVFVVNPRRRKRRKRKNAWYGERRRHSLAAKKAWRTRKRLYGPSGRRTNAWYGDPEGHRRAALKGWRHRRRSRRRNPSVGYYTGALTSYAKEVFTVKNIVGGGLGVAATITIPKVVGWDRDWKDPVASGITTVVGGVLLSHFDEDVGKAFGVAGAAVTGLKVIRLLLGKTTFGKKALSKLSIKGSQEEEIGQEDFEEEDLFEGLEGLGDFSDIGQEDELEEEELFGLGEDEEIGEEALEPTFSGTE